MLLVCPELICVRAKYKKAGNGSQSILKRATEVHPRARPIRVGLSGHNTIFGQLPPLPPPLGCPTRGVLVLVPQGPLHCCKMGEEVASDIMAARERMIARRFGGANSTRTGGVRRKKKNVHKTATSGEFDVLGASLAVETSAGLQQQNLQPERGYVTTRDT